MYSRDMEYETVTSGSFFSFESEGQPPTGPESFSWNIARVRILQASRDFQGATNGK